MTQQTVQTPSEAADDETSQRRQFIKYTFLKLRPEWRRLSGQERTEGREALLAVLKEPPEGLTLRTYSLVGIRGDADVLLWTIAQELDAVQSFVARILATPLGGYLDVPYSYLAMSRKSEYLGKHRHAGQEGAQVVREPTDQPFLFVYPFTKKREWYSLPFEERQRMMGAHFKTGHKYPDIKIHTGYSFGLDDQEFVLAFGGDDPGQFLDLVNELRTSEASKYTEVETPIFTCVRKEPADLVGQWGL